MICRSAIRRGLFAGFAAFAAALMAICSPVAPLVAQDDGGPSSQVSPPGDASNADDDGDSEVAPAALPVVKQEGISLFRLFLSAGWWLVPLLVFSILVVTITIERALALRRSRVVPDELIVSLGQLGSLPGGFDPRQAYRLCQQYPSATSTVIRAMLLKVGRPHSEVEHAVAEASEREAERLYANVRWLTLAAAVAPLFGLTGTVWGMILAFRQTTILEVGQNKANFLAEGIYTALVTTLGGLLIAIPAAIAAHWFEGRIQSLFHKIDELLFNLLPQIERYEGRVRFGRQLDEEPEPEEPQPAEPPVAVK